jgi:hypothetical protein
MKNSRVNSVLFSAVCFAVWRAREYSRVGGAVRCCENFFRYEELHENVGANAVKCGASAQSATSLSRARMAAAERYRAVD